METEVKNGTQETVEYIIEGHIHFDGPNRPGQWVSLGRDVDGTRLDYWRRFVDAKYYDQVRIVKRTILTTTTIVREVEEAKGLIR